MITREEATLLAKQYIEQRLDGPELALELRPELTAEYSFGWIFFYNSREFIRTGDFRDAVAGNAPLLVERETGRLLVTGTAYATETYIERYLATGDPHGELSRRVALEARAADLDRPSAIVALRELAGLRMFEAKVLVDRGLKGETVTVATADAEAAGQLMARFEALGWSARRHYE